MVDMVHGGFAYGHLFIAQHRNIKSVLTDLILDIKPSRILEIGSFHGGLTMMLSDILLDNNLNDTIIKTYDIEDQTFLKPLAKDRPNIEIYTENLFTNDYSSFKDNISYNTIANFIQSDGVTMVMCDGGCKKCEVNILAPLLKENDIIMAHDYAPNEVYFEKNIKDKVWNWLEIQEKDIENTIIDNNLEPYMQDKLQTVAWMCKKKNTNKN